MQNPPDKQDEERQEESSDVAGRARQVLAFAQDMLRCSKLVSIKGCRASCFSYSRMRASCGHFEPLPGP